MRYANTSGKPLGTLPVTRYPAPRVGQSGRKGWQAGLAVFHNRLTDERDH